MVTWKSSPTLSSLSLRGCEALILAKKVSHPTFGKGGPDTGRITAQGMLHSYARRKKTEKRSKEFWGGRLFVAVAVGCLWEALVCWFGLGFFSILPCGRLQVPPLLPMDCSNAT